ncbi:hypothetical protein P5V15_005574 [Pogonomyrmex californicus]
MSRRRLPSHGDVSSESIMLLGKLKRTLKAKCGRRTVRNASCKTGVVIARGRRTCSDDVRLVPSDNKWDIRKGKGGTWEGRRAEKTPPRLGGEGGKAKREINSGHGAREKRYVYI